MNSWTKFPQLYEINTWVWLDELSRSAGRRITLASVPDVEWESIAALGFDAVWLMGVWERSPQAKQILQADAGLNAAAREALPDIGDADLAGPAFSIRRYRVDARLGGPEGLAAARAKLAAAGLRLILDFAPNHVAPDHPWLALQPAYFVRGDAADLSREPAAFLDLDGAVFACGKGPDSAAWPDRIQLDAYNPGQRTAAADALSAIAGQCDGVRCEKAALMLNSVFTETWGHRIGARPKSEYWAEVIAAVKDKHPGFLFIGEADWEKEWELQQQGFDYCYDKRLYQRLVQGAAESVRLHLGADCAYQDKLIRFIETDDTPRAAGALSAAQHRAAAVAALTLPGARLIHEGQLEGLRVRVPDFLGRRPAETPDDELLGFYVRLLAASKQTAFRQGKWQLCELGGWPDNLSCNNLAAWTWHSESSRCLIVVNLSETQSQGMVKFVWPGLSERSWRLNDIFQSTSFAHQGADLAGEGLYVDLPGWAFHFFIAE